jgi:hypothetical protein
MTDKKIFQVEHLYRLYLERMYLQEEGMHREQKIQLKQAFFAGFGQAIITMVVDVGALEEKEATEVLEDMTLQVEDYWSRFLPNDVKLNVFKPK